MAGYIQLIGRVLNHVIVQAPGYTQSYNRYSYCMNNPLRYTDPSGWQTAPADQYWNLGAENDQMSIGTHNSIFSGGGGYIGQMGYTSLGDGIYLDVATGERVDFSTVYFDYILPNSRSANEFLVKWRDSYNLQKAYEDKMALAAASNIGYGMSFEGELGGGDPSGQGGNPSLIAFGPEHTDAFDGFWGKASYFFFGPNVGNARYDMNGNYLGPALITGMAPTPGFKGGSVFIKGLGSVEKELFHLSTKPDILQAAGNFSKVVGRNPDIAVKEGLIILKGTGPYSGKVFQTGLNALDYFGF